MVIFSYSCYKVRKCPGQRLITLCVCHIKVLEIPTEIRQTRPLEYLCRAATKRQGLAPLSASLCHAASFYTPAHHVIAIALSGTSVRDTFLVWMCTVLTILSNHQEQVSRSRNGAYNNWAPRNIISSTTGVWIMKTNYTSLQGCRTTFLSCSLYRLSAASSQYFHLPFQK